MSEVRMPAESVLKPNWRAIAEDYEGQVAYVLRRCLAAEGNDGDLVATEVLIADMEDVSRL